MKRTLVFLLLTVVLVLIGSTLPPITTAQSPPASKQGTRSTVEPTGTVGKTAAEPRSAPLPAKPTVPGDVIIGSEFTLPLVVPTGVRQVGDNSYSITAARPLAVAAKLLSQKLGVPISYEDAAWVSDSDVQNAKVSDSVLRSAGPNYKVPLVPRESTFDFGIAGALSGNIGFSIQAVIDSYHRFRNPGEFELRRFGEGEFSIVARLAADKSGKLIPQDLPLDTKISFSAKKRTLNNAIEEICKAVSASGRTPLIDVSPVASYLDANYTELGANNETARDVLSRLFRRKPAPGQSGEGKISWLVYFDPGGKAAYLNLYPVRVEVKQPDGTLRMKDVVWTADSEKK